MSPHMTAKYNTLAPTPPAGWHEFILLLGFVSQRSTWVGGGGVCYKTACNQKSQGYVFAQSLENTENQAQKAEFSSGV